MHKGGRGGRSENREAEERMSAGRQRARWHLEMFRCFMTFLLQLLGVILSIDELDNVSISETRKQWR